MKVPLITWVIRKANENLWVTHREISKYFPVRLVDTLWLKAGNVGAPKSNDSCCGMMVNRNANVVHLVLKVIPGFIAQQISVSHYFLHDVNLIHPNHNTRVEWWTAIISFKLFVSLLGLWYISNLQLLLYFVSYFTFYTLIAIYIQGTVFVFHILSRDNHRISNFFHLVFVHLVMQCVIPTMRCNPIMVVLR